MPLAALAFVALFPLLLLIEELFEGRAVLAAFDPLDVLDAGELFDAVEAGLVFAARGTEDDVAESLFTTLTVGDVGTEDLDSDSAMESLSERFPVFDGFVPALDERAFEEPEFDELEADGVVLAVLEFIPEKAGVEFVVPVLAAGVDADATDGGVDVVAADAVDGTEESLDVLLEAGTEDSPDVLGVDSAGVLLEAGVAAEARAGESGVRLNAPRSPLSDADARAGDSVTPRPSLLAASLFESSIAERALSLRT